MDNLSFKIYNIIRDDENETLLSKVFDYSIVALILINVIDIIAGTFDNVPQFFISIFEPLEIFSIIVFTVEYILRVWTANYIYPRMKPWKARLRYIFSFMAIIDLLAIVPFYLPYVFHIDLRVLRMLRLLRIIRILKLNRYSEALLTVEKVLKNKAAQLISSLLVILILLVVASVLMYYLEHDAQPDVFKNAFSGLWWSLVTLSTVEYDDIEPITTIGRFMSTIISLLGIALIAIPTGIISAGFMENQSSDTKKEGDN